MNVQGRNAARDALIRKLAANPDTRKRMEEEVAELERKAELEKLRGPHPVKSTVILEERVHVPDETADLLTRVFVQEALDQTRLLRAEKGLGFGPPPATDDVLADHAMLLHAYERCRIELVKTHERAESMHRRAQKIEGALEHARREFFVSVGIRLDLVAKQAGRIQQEAQRASNSVNCHFPLPRPKR